ncbi:MAG: DUF523 domain-containing protein [Gammaproteobacteria bacterium]|nr:DUF523 domain-containing protein [Gammaproteobacteria bacterium]
MHKILISACLIGEKVRYDGGDCHTHSPIIEQWQQQGRLVLLCPEVAGGLPIPRAPAEIRHGTGAMVLDKTANIMTADHNDLSQQFISGAEQTLTLARTHKIKLAILKEGSPSCGSNYIYDGSFTSIKRTGSGVTAALLQRNHIKVFSEHCLIEATAFLNTMGS